MLPYSDWDDVKELAKHKVGGKKVIEKNFENLTFAELQITFNPNKKDVDDYTDDEFIELYKNIKKKID